MRGFRNIIIATLIALAGGSCFEQPEFSDIPQIVFEDMTYKRVGNTDSLIFYISFQDGDGDLGLDVSEKGCFLNGEENLICFQNKIHELYQNEAGDYGIVDTGTSCTGTSMCYTEKFFILKPDRTLISYEDKRTDPNYVSLPAFEKPFNCVNWQRVFNSSDIVTDTVFVQRNPDHYNFEIDFMVRNPDGINFTEFDFTKEYDFPNCGIAFDGRFPILFSDRSGSPLEGVIRFGIGSPFLKTQFSLKTLKFKIRIKDRALNESNEVESPLITF